MILLKKQAYSSFSTLNPGSKFCVYVSLSPDIDTCTAFFFKAVNSLHGFRVLQSSMLASRVCPPTQTVAATSAHGAGFDTLSPFPPGVAVHVITHFNTSPVFARLLHTVYRIARSIVTVNIIFVSP